MNTKIQHFPKQTPKYSCAKTKQSHWHLLNGKFFKKIYIDFYGQDMDPKSVFRKCTIWRVGRGKKRLEADRKCLP